MENLDFKIVSAKPSGKEHVNFTIEVIDEKSLQYLELKYPGKLQFDGGRTYTLTFMASLKGMPQDNPNMWEHLTNTEPELVHKFVLGRLMGEF